MPRQTLAFRVPMRHPGDVSGIAALMDAGTLHARDIVAILGKTEGNGCVNDFTRAYAVSALSALLVARGGRPAEDVALVMSGGTEGGLAPHFLVLAVHDTAAPGTDALAIGTAFTRDLAPEEIGRMAQIHAVAAAVHAAMAQAGLGTAHYVQVKCPLLTSEKTHGRDVVTADTYASMGLSRGASALGVALALGEVPADALSDAVIGQDWSLHSSRAACSAGVELDRCEVIVLGNSPAWAGDLIIGHDVMGDAIDLPAVQRALASVGALADTSRVMAVLAKAEPSSTGLIRGLRHIMNDDSDINATRHARALVGGVIAGAVGRTDLFVSGGAEHQGPDGGGPIAVIAQR